MNNCVDLMKVLGYEFKNIGLLDTALTHSSYANECGGENYERLEFLGDAVIELVVSDYIIRFKEPHLMTTVSIPIPSVTQSRRFSPVIECCPGRVYSYLYMLTS